MIHFNLWKQVENDKKQILLLTCYPRLFFFTCLLGFLSSPPIISSKFSKLLGKLFSQECIVGLRLTLHCAVCQSAMFLKIKGIPVEEYFFSVCVDNLQRHVTQVRLLARKGDTLEGLRQLNSLWKWCLKSNQDSLVPTSHMTCISKVVMATFLPNMDINNSVSNRHFWLQPYWHKMSGKHSYN